MKLLFYYEYIVIGLCNICNMKDQPIAKNRTEYTRSIFFFIQKINKPTASIGQHSRSKWLSEEEETSLLWQSKNKPIIIHKIQRPIIIHKIQKSNKTDHDQQKLQ